MQRQSRKTYAPRIIGDRRVPKSVGIDPLHYHELAQIARGAGYRGNPASISFVVDGILMDYFKMFSPRYGDEIGSNDATEIRRSGREKETHARNRVANRANVGRVAVEKLLRFEKRRNAS